MRQRNITKKLKIIYQYQTIKIMHTSRVPNALFSTEDAEKQFQKDMQSQKKLEELKSAVFKNFNIRRSKPIFHPTQTLTLFKKSDSNWRNTFHFPNRQRQDSPQLRCPQTAKDPQHQQSSNLQESPSIMNIKFGTDSLRRSASLRVVKPSKNMPTFSPRKTSYNIKKTSFQIDDKARPYEPNPEVKLKRSLTSKQKLTEQRDSQTILRKNSLFLVNCLKTRFKESYKKAHIGEAQNVANIRLGAHHQKNGMTHYQQRFEYMEEARQRMLLARGENEQNRLSKISPLLPEPW